MADYVIMTEVQGLGRSVFGLDKSYEYSETQTGIGIGPWVLVPSGKPIVGLHLQIAPQESGKGVIPTIAKVEYSRDLVANIISQDPIRYDWAGGEISSQVGVQTDSLTEAQGVAAFRLNVVSGDLPVKLCARA